MNRRSFLSFLSVAPVVLPMAAKELASASAAPGWIGEVNYLTPINADLIRDKLWDVSSDGGFLVPGEHSDEILKVCEFMRESSSVEAQMRDDDLFELDSSVIGESVPQTARSPEQQKEDRVS